jgi:hypothetical protein
MAKKKLAKKAKEDKKVMKKTVNAREAFDKGISSIRKLFNSILTSSKGALVLTENKHGAVQVKRSGDLLFSARSNGKMIITHPMFDGKGKKKTRVYTVSGNKWDHLSEVPFENVTLDMLKARVADSKTTKDYHVQIYKSRMDESGLVAKTKAAKVRAEAAKKEAGTKVTKAKKTKAIARQAKKPTKKKRTKAIRKVATVTA